MARIQFTLPDRFSFVTDMQIYISHVDQDGHLDNPQLLTLVSEARVRFFKSLGYTEGNVAGHPIVVGDIVAQYKSEGFHGETMRVSMVPQDFNPYGFDLVFQMACPDSGRESGSRQNWHRVHRPGQPEGLSRAASVSGQNGRHGGLNTVA